MRLKTITREEFDQRLDAANDRAEAELRQLEQENRLLQELIERYEFLQMEQAQPAVNLRASELRRLLLQLADSSLEAAQAL